MDPPVQHLEDLPAADFNATAGTWWCQAWDAVHSTTLGVLVRARRQHQDLFDENDEAISSLMEEKNRLCRAYLDSPNDAHKAAFHHCRRLAQQRLREMQEGSTLLTEKSQILKRGPSTSEVSSTVPSRSLTPPSSGSAQVEINIDPDPPPSLPEAIRDVRHLSSKKARGYGAIPADIYKHSDHRLMGQLTALSREMWRQGQVTQDFGDATVLHLYKSVENRHLCDNHRGILLLKTTGKIFSRALLNRLTNHLESGLLPEIQCGFQRHRGITNMVFVARQLQEVLRALLMRGPSLELSRCGKCRDSEGCRLTPQLSPRGLPSCVYLCEDAD
ncbi:hypothetical protein SprV_0100123800 [Sparganum proliferum]